MILAMELADPEKYPNLQLTRVLGLVYSSPVCIKYHNNTAVMG
jgi:hypothetical protein